MKAASIERCGSVLKRPFDGRQNTFLHFRIRDGKLKMTLLKCRRKESSREA